MIDRYGIGFDKCHSMKLIKSVLVPIILWGVVLASQLVVAQTSICKSLFTHSVIYQNNEIEKQLSGSTILYDLPIKIGAFGAKFVELSNGLQGVWKSDEFASLTGSYNSSHAEVAAYKIDRYLGLSRVPPTIHKIYKGESGSLQLRVQDLRDLPRGTEYVPYQPVFGFFDYLIGNNDRNSNNILQRQEGSIVAIDHGVAFQERELHVLSNFKSVFVDYKNNLKNQNEFSEEQKRRLSYLVAFFPSRTVVARLRLMTFEKWKNLVGKELSDIQIENMVKRQKELLNKLDEVEQFLGSDLVYPQSKADPILYVQKVYHYM